MGAIVPGVESSAWLTLELGAREVRAIGGLPTAAGTSRPLLAVACDDRTASVEPAMLHLVDVLGVKGVVADMDDTALTSLLTLPSTRGRAAVLSSRGSDLARPSDGADLLWSFGAPGAGAASVYPGLLGRIEASATLSGASPGSLRMIALVSAASEDVALADAVTPTLTLQSTSLQELVRQDRYRTQSLSDDDPAERLQALADVVAFAPDVVLLFGGGAFSAPLGVERASIIAEVEAAAASSGWRPVYVLGPRNISDASLASLARRSAAFRDHALGVTSTPAVDPMQAASLAARFADAYPDAQLDNRTYSAAAGVYDAFYFLAHALAAAPRARKAVDVAELLQGFQRATQEGAEPVTVGPGASGLEKATSLLRDGLPFDLTGVTGSAALGPARARPATLDVYCFGGAGDVVLLGARLSPQGTLDSDGLSAPSAEQGRSCGREVLP
jgi:hypothetical protein